MDVNSCCAKNMSDFSSDFRKFLNTRLLHTRLVENERGDVQLSFGAFNSGNGPILKKLWVYEGLLVRMSRCHSVMLT